MSKGNTTTECFVCDNLDITHTDRWEASRKLLTGYQRIEKYLDLQEAASRGCQICSVVLEGIVAFQGRIALNGANTRVWFRCNPPMQPLEVGIQEHERAVVIWLEFFTLAGQPAPWTGFGAAGFVPERIDADTGCRTIRQWLDDCNKHDGCTGFRNHSTILPTRVLDLGENPTAQDSIKLFETGGDKGTYMTLSHCWGPAQLITTTANTIEQRKTGIPLEDLPQTFRDAVSLTRNLGIEYLWIDSLCIKQLDKEDWEAEASKMGSVYSHSYLNIAATSSAESRGGCFKERTVSVVGKSSPLAVKSHKIIRGFLGSNMIYVRPVLDSAHTALRRNASFSASVLSPLLSRAWVYQERLLALRTIHFHATELLWECISSSRCECGGLDRKKIDIFRPNTFGAGITREELEEQWLSVVQQYSGLNASHPSDKLTALSGISEQFQAKLQCEYLAGLWSNGLLRGLAWIVADGNKACRRLPYRAPTWSWASLDKLHSPQSEHRGVRVTYVFTKSLRQDNRLEVKSASVPITGNNPYGTVAEGAHIVLKAAFLTPCTAEIETEIVMTGEIESTLLLQFKGHKTKIRVQPDVSFTSLPIGIRQMPNYAQDLRWLFLGEGENQYHGLLLKILDRQRDLYERVGMARFYMLSVDLKDNAEVATFTII